MTGAVAEPGFAIDVRGLNKHYGDKHVVQDVSIQVERGRITEVLKKKNIRPITNGGFSLSVGTPVPRTVHLHRLPREIVELNPRWRPYEFVLVGNEIVIINPRNFEIVAVMPA